MNEKIRLLQAEIQADLEKIAETYIELEELKQQPSDKTRDITFGYYLHVLYGLFENLFTRIAENFGNQVENKSRWHSELLWRMTLDVMPIRPAVINRESYQCLNELRGFRHLFRNAYLLHFDPIRLDITWQYADKLRALYRTDLNKFLDFLNAINDE
jgi:hypothetical protein